MMLLLLVACLQANARNERDTLGVGTQVLFVRNDGQWDARVRYEAQLHDAALFLEDDGLTVALRQPVAHPAPGSGKPAKMHAYKMRFVGGGAVPMGEAMQPGYSNYYIGDNPARWRSRVPSFAVARYTDIYNGIDLELYTASDALKYNLIVHPGADPSAIAIEYTGTDGVKVTKEGNLLISTSVRDIIELQPYVYQGKNEIKSRWRVSRKEDTYSVSIELGDYDHTRDLVIDPLVRLRFSTYTGSTADNWGTTGTYDSHKNTYTAGLERATLRTSVSSSSTRQAASASTPPIWAVRRPTCRTASMSTPSTSSLYSAPPAAPTSPPPPMPTAAPSPVAPT